MCQDASAKFKEIGCELVPQLPYSRDFSNSDYFLFPNKTYGGNRVESNDEIIAQTNAYSEDFENYLEGEKIGEILKTMSEDHYTLYNKTILL